MRLMSITTTLLLAFCMSCSTTDPIPEPGPSHPASSSAPVPVIAGPSDLLATHDPLPRLSTEQEPDAASEHDHEAMGHDPSPTTREHGVMAPDTPDLETEPAAHDHGQHIPPAESPVAPPADAHADHDDDAAESEKVVYVCPMHPDQRSNQPANCPICGMEMEPVEVEP